MESKLLKVKLKPGSKAHFVQLVEYMQRNVNQPLSEMQQKGYFWDSFFISEDDDLYMVLKSADFSSIMLDESALIATHFRDVYEEFRQNCWVVGSYEDIESLYCFNQAISFMGNTVAT
jgi:hypothetical protein